MTRQVNLGDTFDVKFTTRRFSTGAPYTLSGTPAISAYVGNSTTEITSGITLTTDFDSRTGLNNVRVVATSGNGFATGDNVALVITAGTVDSVSVVGEVVGEFTIVPSINVSSGVIEANAVQISGDSTAADNLEADYDGTGYAKTNSTVGTVTATTSVTNAVSANITKVNSVTITGAGTTEDPWRPA